MDNFYPIIEYITKKYMINQSLFEYFADNFGSERADQDAGNSLLFHSKPFSGIHCMRKRLPEQTLRQPIFYRTSALIISYTFPYFPFRHQLSSSSSCVRQSMLSSIVELLCRSALAAGARSPNAPSRIKAPLKPITKR